MHLRVEPSKWTVFEDDHVHQEYGTEQAAYDAMWALRAERYEGVTAYTPRGRTSKLYKLACDIMDAHGCDFGGSHTCGPAGLFCYTIEAWVPRAGVQAYRQALTDAGISLEPIAE